MSSAETQGAAAGSPATQVQLPAGWTAGPGRETTASVNGQVLQGTMVPINSVTGANSTVFIPYTTLALGLQAVQAVFDQRIASLSILPGN